jgi:cardiolipin synthase
MNPPKPRTKARVAKAVVLSVLATLAAVVIALNLSSGERKVNHRIAHLYAVGDPQFVRSLGNLLGPPLVGGNAVVELLNGDEIFPAMLSAIRSAQRTITFETYIYWSGSVGEEFAEALSQRATAGVKVHLLIDWVGSGKMDQETLQKMEWAGVEIERYRPLHWYTIGRINHRTHRKLLVVDGKIGFTGGVGIADEWRGNAQDENHWRDSHYRLEGPAVAHMQAAFLDNWLKTHAVVLHGEDYFPALPAVGGAIAQVFKSSSREGSESVRMMYLLSIAAARKSILLSAAYFVPDDLSVQMLVEARQRGVRVDIVVPGAIMDVPLTRRASRSRWGPLLEAGVEIYEYVPTMYHCKVMIVDGVWVSVGSTNFDNRSFRLNDEANLNVLDRELAERMTKTFEDDKARSRRVTLEQWRQRPWNEKVIEHAAGLLRSQV